MATDVPVWKEVGPHRSGVLATVARYVHTLAFADRVAIFLIDRDAPEFLIAVAGVPADVIGRRFRADQGIPGEVLAHDEPVVIRDYQALERPLHYTGTDEFVAGAGVPIHIDGVARGALSAYTVSAEREFSDADVQMLVDSAQIGGLALEHAEMRERLDQTLRATVRAMASAVDLHDNYTAEHSREVVDLACRVGTRLGMLDDELRDLEFAALLHDLGKVGVRDAILNKPGRLDAEEWRQMRQHPLLGEMLLLEIPGLEEVARAVRGAHEHHDGGGYPDGLEGDAIPLASRVILACDAYHAMTTDRPYRAALGHDDAVAELEREAGRQFDPGVAALLVDVLETEGAGGPPPA